MKGLFVFGLALILFSCTNGDAPERESSDQVMNADSNSSRLHPAATPDTSTRIITPSINDSLAGTVPNR